MKNKVLILINGGCVQVEYKPDNIEIEIRDYDTDGVDEEVLQKDEDGDEYQEMIFPAENEKVADNDDVEMLYRNYYRHNECNTEWEDEWDSMCDDECPECGTAISPYKSDDLNSGETTEHHDPKDD